MGTVTMRGLLLGFAMLVGAGLAHAAEELSGVRGLQPGSVQGSAPASGGAQIGVPAAASSPGAATPGATPAAAAAPGNVPAAPGGAPLEVEMAPVSAQVAVNQPVLFRVRAGRDMHFSVLSVGPDGRAQQLMPRPGAAARTLAAGVTHELPQDYELRVPAPGTEKLYLVALHNPLNAIGADGKPAVEPASSAQAGPAADPGVVVREVLLEVVEPAAAVPPATVAQPPAAPPTGAQAPATTALPTLVLDSPQRVYRIGEPVALQYGASRDGWLHLFLQVGGALKPLGVKAVQAERFATLHATATAPAGEQAVVALWSPTEQLDAAARAALERRLRADPTAGEPARALAVVVDVPIAYRTLPLLINP